MPLLDIFKIAENAGIDPSYIIPYGKYKAKIDLSIMRQLNEEKDGKLVLVTAITPTKAGEGKTTTSIALSEGLGKINKKSILCLREPSLGPVFGLKGGATGGGLASIEPSEDINLHFMGDMHALTSSINLISAIIDNSIYQGNPLNIDPKRILWKRALDMNDRALRNVMVSIDEKGATPRIDHFTITVASELMAIMCLSNNKEDFLSRIEKITVAFTKNNEPVTLKDLKITHAIMRLMNEALNPNLVQTLENTPCFVHGGPFANIAHGCSSLIATKLALKLSPIVITEAGFGADLGAEKFFDIKCQEGNLHPDCVVIVATIRALKMHGGLSYDDLFNENLECLEKGMPNLERHIENIKKFKIPFIIAINHFDSDSEKEIDYIISWCKSRGYVCSFLDGFKKGGEGSIDLAKKVSSLLDSTVSYFTPLYERNWPIKEKIAKICKEIYRADDVIYEEKAIRKIKEIEKLGYSNGYICMAKTPSSFSDNPMLLGAPKNFKITVKDVNLSSGANFIVVLTGNILTMPGLPKVPAAVKMEDEPWQF
ncbi:MAG TPA: formate--tetrahydrofolate ligase [Firmicutes bacterium]|nr:formate--tetrahydrofolate ligase [Bacillota bacterium]